MSQIVHHDVSLPSITSINKRSRMAKSPIQALRSSYARTISTDTVLRHSTSWTLAPLPLFLIRCLISLYCFVTLFINLGLSSRTAAGQSFSYFTVLGYWGLAFYFVFAAIHTGSYLITGRCLLERWPGWLRFAHGGLYASVTVFPFLVTSKLISSDVVCHCMGY
jgi:hypothetical protein